MSAGFIEISVKGKPVRVPSATVNGRTVVVTGNWLKTAAVMDETLLNGENVPDPKAFVSQMKDAGLKADVFTFSQKLPDITPHYQYLMEPESVAIVPITTYADWLEKRVQKDVRKAIKRAAREGVEVRLAEFNDEFVRGVCNIYNDTPVRQGRPFWHYQKDFETVKRDNSSYLDRSAFIGAYFQGELIGFIKMVYVDSVALTLQVISQTKHFDKKPTNALLAKAVEICAERGVTHFGYGNYVYKDPRSSLTEFKQRNGFEEFLVPKYYVPLTLKGAIALKLRLHHRLADRIPPGAYAWLRKIRSAWNTRRLQSSAGVS